MTAIMLSPATLIAAVFLSGRSIRQWPGPVPRSGMVLRHGDAARVDADRLQLVVREVVGPDELAVPVRLLVGEPAHCGAERTRLARLARGGVDQGDVLRADVEDVDRLGRWPAAPTALAAGSRAGGWLARRAGGLACRGRGCVERTGRRARRRGRRAASAGAHAGVAPARRPRSATVSAARWRPASRVRRRGRRRRAPSGPSPTRPTWSVVSPATRGGQSAGPQCDGGFAVSSGLMILPAMPLLTVGCTCYASSSAPTASSCCPRLGHQLRLARPRRRRA